MSIRKTAILSIALVAAALVGCSKKEEAPDTTVVVPETQAPMTTTPATPEPTPPPAAPMEQHPMDQTAPSDGTMTTPPPADGTKAPE